MEANTQPGQIEIQEILRRCEEKAAYGSPQVDLSTGDAEIIVVSDLHLAAGKKPNGNFSGTENFFADASFLRFIRSTLDRLESRSAILVINGDLVDFLRVSEYPQTDNELVEWRAFLEPLGISMTVEDLRDSISAKEREFGLRTNDYKAVWQLSMVIRGHTPVFDALAEWIGAGHQIIIVKGNHDLQLIWPAVRNYLRLDLAQRLLNLQPTRLLREILADVVGPKLLFVDDSLVIDDIFYLEHGHRYDKHAWPVGPAILPNAKELNIPFGSFFNRYLLNRIELAYPYIDNVRPTVNVLPLLIRERFFLAMKLIFYHLPFAVRIIPKRYFGYLFGRFTVMLAALGLPFLLALVYLLSAFPQLWGIIKGIPTANWPGSSLAKSFAALTASYFLSRVVAYFQLAEPFTLAPFARPIFATHPRYQLIAMGHTHNPEQFNQDGRWFYNTGTWIPIVETSSGELREDKTYAFLHVRRDSSGRLQPPVLERWDDEAGRSEELVIVERK